MAASPSLPAPIARIETHVFRWPVTVPVRTSFGSMTDRPAVLVRVEDADGAHGWGEAWCNFPSCGAEHRARLIGSVLAPLLIGRRFTSPEAAFDALTAATAVLALQSGEPGPMAQAISAVDIALHDLSARRAGLPLWRLLAPRAEGRRPVPGEGQRPVRAEGQRPAQAEGQPPVPAEGGRPVPVYASGINPDRPGDTVSRLRALGHTAFKLKVGFGAERDHGNLQAMRAAAGTAATLLVDANQAWSIDEALPMAQRLAEHAPAWLEEPLRADRPAAEWQRLAEVSPIPLAAGENCIGDAAFDALIAMRAVAVVQPDVAKWGGISGVRRVIARIDAAGLRWCPHYLGAGIGLQASAHLVAARAPQLQGWLEVDSNENPLRDLLCPPLATLQGGAIVLDAATPGLGIEPDLAALREACATRA